MKPFQLATAFFVSLFSTVTFAQVIMKGETMSVATASPYDWTGFYAGVNAGAVNHTMNITDVQGTSFFSTIQQVSNPHFTGGFQIGYRRQLDLTKASGVYGAEFSANFSNATFNKQYGSPFSLYQFQSKNELNNVYLLQLLGGLAADRTLLFLAAGISWTNITGNSISLGGSPFFNSFNVNKKVFGTALGAGIEYAYTEKVSVRFKVDAVTPKTYSTLDAIGNTFSIANTIVQGVVGVNYKFG